jgi:hypothetical protein
MTESTILYLSSIAQQNVDGVGCEVAGHGDVLAKLAAKGWNVTFISACAREGTPGVYVLLQRDTPDP